MDTDSNKHVWTILAVIGQLGNAIDHLSGGDDLALLQQAHDLVHNAERDLFTLIREITAPA
jgi:hypothetical protein